MASADDSFGKGGSCGEGNKIEAQERTHGVAEPSGFKDGKIS